jgi:hypothetical protein
MSLVVALPKKPITSRTWVRAQLCKLQTRGSVVQFFFLIGRFLKIFSSETARPNGAKLGRKHLCKILYKTSSFNSIIINGF